MKSILLLFVIALTISSCSQKFDISGHYDPLQSFEITDFEIADHSISDFQVNDLKHDQLLSWLGSNNQNWKETHNTHAALVIISQEKFSLLLYRNNDFAVVIIKDEEKNSHYYKKTVDTSGLKFLDE